MGPPPRASRSSTMKATHKLTLRLAVLLIGLVTARVHGQTYDLSWFTIDGGGGQASSGDFSLGGTIGQPDAGAMTGGSFELVGGFWATSDSAGCGSADFNCDGDIGTDADIEA